VLTKGYVLGISADSIHASRIAGSSSSIAKRLETFDYSNQTGQSEITQAMKRVMNEKLIFISTKITAQTEAVEQESIDRLQFSKEAFFNDLLGLVLQKNCMLKRRFASLINLLWVAGLIEKWTDWSIFNPEKSKPRQTSVTEKQDA